MSNPCPYVSSGSTPPTWSVTGKRFTAVDIITYPGDYHEFQSLSLVLDYTVGLASVTPGFYFFFKGVDHFWCSPDDWPGVTSGPDDQSLNVVRTITGDSSHATGGQDHPMSGSIEIIRYVTTTQFFNYFFDYVQETLSWACPATPEPLFEKADNLVAS